MHPSATLQCARPLPCVRLFVRPRSVRPRAIPMALSRVKLSDEVRDAMDYGKPVVALESTIISHGMPYPQNLETAKEVEAAVREAGAVPATIAVIGGTPKAGLTEEELERLASKGKEVRKCSTRDLPLVVSQGMDGATTVAATMFLANAAGIGVFVTGGLGGVHRGGENTMDISADLTMAGKVPVLVVCAGAKTVLDIPRTLEYLETQGVCVCAYGSDNFPAFFSPDSGCKAPVRVDTPKQAAGLITSSINLGLKSGVIVGVPIPEEFAAEGERVEAAISQALEESEEQNIGGAEVTPFLLSRIAELTEGESLSSNIKLIKNNARVGARIAACMMGYDEEGDEFFRER
ncbi:hypothetical protein BSKO_10922 [Bryopsis sp. KO-2023]|nr:hypothetical protein BSKO_10922 [Bryopsis sp. KO-2023]